MGPPPPPPPKRPTRSRTIACACGQVALLGDPVFIRPPFFSLFLPPLPLSPLLWLATIRAFPADAREELARRSIGGSTNAPSCRKVFFFPFFPSFPSSCPTSSTSSAARRCSRSAPAGSEGDYIVPVTSLHNDYKIFFFLFPSSSPYLLIEIGLQRCTRKSSRKVADGVITAVSCSEDPLFPSPFSFRACSSSRAWQD